VVKSFPFHLIKSRELIYRVFVIRKTKEETNTPRKSGGAERRLAEIPIVKVLLKKRPGSLKNVVECAWAIILEQLF
jgi:hypothetical protein